MRILPDATSLQPFARGLFVPTMGALHAGHFALVRRAAALRDADPRRPPVIVSIFVNPTQFNDPADLARYPRTLDADAAGCQAAGADAIFAPSPSVVYPPGAITPVPPLPAVATEPNLEDAHRPGHFAGVCQVVARLFDLVRPSAALFGEKDWQQLAVISAMTRAASVPIRIVPCETVREPDGLAMSSRNVFLSPDDRRRALALSQALCNACGATDAHAAQAAMLHTLAPLSITPEYAVIRDAETLLDPIQSRPARALIAAWAGKVRLIDNCAWPR